MPKVGTKCSRGSTEKIQCLERKKKTIATTNVTGFYTFFSARKAGNFVCILGCVSHSITQKPGEKGRKSAGESSRNPVEKITPFLSYNSV